MQVQSYGDYYTMSREIPYLPKDFPYMSKINVASVARL